MNSPTSLIANTAEEKHTPTPWQFELSYSKSVHGSQCVGFIDNGDTNIADVVASYNMTDGEALANAAFIVLACNSFDALTEANAKLSSALQRLVSAVEFMRTMGAYRGGSLAGMGELDRAEAEGRAALKSTGAK